MKTKLPEPLAVSSLVIDVLEYLDVADVIGSSLASAQHGMARSTLDSDLVVKLSESQGSSRLFQDT